MEPPSRLREGEYLMFSSPLFTDREMLLALGLVGVMDETVMEPLLARLNVESPIGREFGIKEVDLLQQKAEWFVRGLSAGWVDLCPLKPGALPPGVKALGEEGREEGPLPKAENDGN